SLVLPAPPWSVDSTPPAAPRRSVPPTPPLSLRLHHGPPAPPRSPEPWTPPWPSGSSVSLGLVGSLFPPRASPPLAPPPSE
ncbi:hypothetical protein M9458_025425, partial [Cirrhinus mrigala]